MIGFIVNPNELIDAAWFDKNHLSQLPPPLSLSHMLIDTYLGM